MAVKTTNKYKKPNGEWNWALLTNGEEHIIKLTHLEQKNFSKYFLQAVRAKNPKASSSIHWDFENNSGYIVKAIYV